MQKAIDKIIVCNGTQLLLISMDTYLQLDKSYVWSICEVDQLGVIRCVNPLCECKQQPGPIWPHPKPSAACSTRAGSPNTLSRF